jgi:uncharacterized damage-inducible protein DinB
MSTPAAPEYWLRGPIENVPSLLQPVAHALLQARDEVEEAIKIFPENKLWEKPGGTASVAFHLQHMTGVLDRLFTYARGEQLNEQQLNYLSLEGKENKAISARGLFEKFSVQVDKAIDELRYTDERKLLETRGVGRKQIPSTVLGLLFHAAEHTQRHNGQLLVTAKVLSSV